MSIADPAKQGATRTDSDKAPSSEVPVSPDPQATSATYGDWVVVCQREAADSPRVCEVSQSIQIQGQPGPIAQLAISRAKQPPSSRLTVVLPPNILLTASPKVAADENGSDAVELAWLRCLPGGCFADAVLKDEVMSKWRSVTERGRLEFKDAAGRALAVPFSFRGLAQAVDALAKE